MHPAPEELKQATKEAVRKAFSALVQEHNEAFYYVVLTTNGEAGVPSFSAWSDEAFARETAQHAGEDVDCIRWSYGDSPYFCYCEEEFSELTRLFARRPAMSTSMSENEWYTEYEMRLGALELAMAELDQEGLFGSGEQRCRMVINVEVMPPDWTNAERAKRLNPPESLVQWLEANGQT